MLDQKERLWISEEIRSYSELFKPKKIDKVLGIFSFNRTYRNHKWTIVGILFGIFAVSAFMSFVTVFEWPDECFILDTNKMQQTMLFDNERGRILQPLPQRPYAELHEYNLPWHARFCNETWNNSGRPEYNRSILRVLLDRDFAMIFGKILVTLFVIVTVYRWFTSKKQAEITEAFSRKLTINRMIIEKPAELGPLVSGALSSNQIAGGPISSHDVVKEMFVFMELDNLEFVFEKFRDNEIGRKLALRQCLIFASRCRSPDFIALVRSLTPKGLNRPDFAIAVDKIMDFAKNFDHLLTGEGKTRSG